MTTGLVFIDPANQAPPPAATEDAISGDGFWPALSIAAARASMRLVTDVTEARVRDALVGALIYADRELADWRAVQAAAGKATPAAVDPAQLAGENRLVILWRRAVYAYAAAELCETHNDITATGEGRTRTEDIRVPAADELRRQATIAIRDLLGKPRTDVGLI